MGLIGGGFDSNDGYIKRIALKILIYFKYISFLVTNLFICLDSFISIVNEVLKFICEFMNHLPKRNYYDF